MQAAIGVRIGVRLVAGVDNRAFHHRVKADFRLEKIGALRNLKWRLPRPVFRPDFSRAGENLARHEKRGELLGQPLERHAPVNEIILMIAVTVAFIIAVVFVNQHLLIARQQRIGRQHALMQDALSGLLVNHNIFGVRAFRRRIFRVRVINVESRPVVKNFVDGRIFLTARRVRLSIHLEAARVHERAFFLVIPDHPHILPAAAIHDENRVRNRIEFRAVFD